MGFCHDISSFGIYSLLYSEKTEKEKEKKEILNVNLGYGEVGNGIPNLHLT
jgi:hypothetical protein